MIESFNRAGWPIEAPKATMFVWAKVPERFKEMKSLEFSKLLLNEARSPYLRASVLASTVTTM